MSCTERECVVDIETDGTTTGVGSSYKCENEGEVLPPGKIEGTMLENTMEKKVEKEKRKSISAKKPPKPPRPPRGLSLDAADQKLIKEIHELALIKRARIDRMKALKKLKAVKASSVSSAFSGSFFAMFFTVVFFMVLIFQGMSSGNGSSSFHDSPESGVPQDQSNLSPSNPSISTNSRHLM
ncbi:unnamed protein product [Cuscuta epithymum]|uniref:Transmembrane protein n=1 Tax=Cuscuta epithymum TaxID=186058 RepID=A0AAV0E368_9ASTE|nr:unnamed protein product [Cuscuta epithymum]